jgi:hypothetical protein
MEDHGGFGTFYNSHGKAGSYDRGQSREETVMQIWSNGSQLRRQEGIQGRQGNKK